MIEVGCRFCGGCDPRYDRMAFLERLRAAFPQLAFSFCGLKDSPDLLLYLSGCETACVRPEASPAVPSFLVTGEEDFPLAAEFLRRAEGPLSRSIPIDLP